MTNETMCIPFPGFSEESKQKLSKIDRIRLTTSAKLDRKKRAKLGQFMTPGSVAKFMAGLFKNCKKKSAHLLDAGAGIGSLSSAFLERWITGGFNFQKAFVTAFEVEPLFQDQLTETLRQYTDKNFSYLVEPLDFIEDSTFLLGFGSGISFTHAILNPPYKKISSNSPHRLMLRQVGVETVNLYSAFVALALARLLPGGQLVAIIPRSFCNGPYYRSFRESILREGALHHIHLFTARNKAFKDDGVLQENIIILLEKSGKQGAVTISTSNDDSFSDFSSFSCPFERVIIPNESESFIHIPVSSDQTFDIFPDSVCYSLAALDLKVSTGPVVDFRLKPHLLPMPVSGSVPLLYPCHFSGQKTEWPKSQSKKANAIMLNAETKRWLMPNGFYAVVRRFSSKEEKRRIVASVVSPELFATNFLGFENHLNVFHREKKGLSKEVIYGLTAFLNSSQVDAFFRRFSGHTQVNATDLRCLKYPSLLQLKAIGQWAISKGQFSQEEIDEKISMLP